MFVLKQAESEKGTAMECWLSGLAAGTDYRFEHCKDKPVFKFNLSCSAFFN